jgi:23S rRNA (cytosine1962-C5)-methyltransferase
MDNYELLDTGKGRRLEKFGKFIISRPDPEVIWNKTLSESQWLKADAVFDNGWTTKNNFKGNWQIGYNGLTLNLKLTPFKHVGIFPEQEFEWELIKKLITNSSNPSILSLFGYTGVSSLFALQNGAKVTHVDASRPAITWFRENQVSSNLIDKPVRLIIDDCLKFVEREVRRGNRYDGVIMDPPAYGHGPNGKPWNFNKDFSKLIDITVKLLSNNPLFFIINAYSVSTSPTTIANLLREKLKGNNGEITQGELSLKEKASQKILTTGIYAIWKKSL